MILKIRDFYIKVESIVEITSVTAYNGARFSFKIYQEGMNDFTLIKSNTAQAAEITKNQIVEEWRKVSGGMIKQIETD